MKKILYFSFFILHSAFYIPSFAQNIVPNPSFEDTASCPDNLGEIYRSLYWYSPTTGSPDYYNQCSSSVYCGVPNNWYGSQIPNTGVAFVGMGTFVLGNTNLREYIQTVLIDTLKGGKKYNVEFYVSLSDSSQYACSNIGAYFSINQVTSGNDKNLPDTPQISNPLNNILSEKINWTKISGSFIASGGEKYITIGNFKDDANSDTLYVGGPSWYTLAYYYIDDVSVIEDTTTGVREFSNEKERYKIKLYPNPNNGTMQMDYNLTEGQTGELIIYNMIGEKINTYHLLSSKNNIKISEAALQNGIYFYQITIDKQAIINDKIVIIK